MHRDPLLRRARFAAPFAAVVLACAVPGPALADAELASSVPAQGEVITSVPDEAVLTFNEPLTANSNFAILDSSGGTVATGAWDAGDPTTIRGPLPDLAPGTYEVQWAAASADGHLPRGTFQFTVAESTTPRSTPTAPSSAAPTASPTPSPTPRANPSPSPDPGAAADSGLDVVLPIAIVALILGIGLAMLLRRRPG